MATLSARTIRFPAVGAGFAALSLLFTPAPLHSQMTMHLATGSRDGGVTSLIAGYHHAIEIPQDALTARATGRRQHAPFVVRKRVDGATPLLYRAMAGSETIPTVTIRVPTSDGRGGVEPVTITLTNARIMAIESGTSDEEASAHEAVSFYYEKIKWTSGAGAEFEDNWRENR